MKLQIVKRIPRLPPRKADSHKGDYGRILVIGGSRGMAGAPSLCSNAAMRAGAGLVRVAIPDAIHVSVATLAPCATMIALPTTPLGTIDPKPTKQRLEYYLGSWADVLAVGPGMMETAYGAVLVDWVLRTSPVPVVLDADGLNNAALMPRSLLRQRAAPMVMTPHPREMQRLLDSAKIRLSALKQRREAAMRLAQDTDTVIVLKGHRTIVTDGRRLYENKTGNPGMATGGTGDVLTGVIAALIGQKLAPFDAAVLGVHVHGLAGDLAARDLGQVSLIATDLIEFLPEAFQKPRR